MFAKKNISFFFSFHFVRRCQILKVNTRIKISECGSSSNKSAGMPFRLAKKGPVCCTAAFWSHYTPAWSERSDHLSSSLFGRIVNFFHKFILYIFFISFLSIPQSKTLILTRPPPLLNKNIFPLMFILQLKAN